MTWKEPFKQHSVQFETRRGAADFILTQDAVKFTSEIIEKIIADIPEHSGWIKGDDKINRSISLDKLKQQLRDKYL